MDTQQEPTSDQDLQTIVSQLPTPIQEFFASGKIDVVAGNLMRKYSFHIDQGTIVEREIIMLLLGLKDPQEFTQALVEEAKLDQKTIDGIVQDINAQIFVPLRDEERRSGVQQIVPPPPRATKPVEVKPTQVPIPVKPPVPGGFAPPLQSPKYFHLENKIPAPTRPTAPVPPRSVNQITKSPVARPDLHSVLATVMAPKPAGISRGGEPPKLLEDHEEPHIELGARDKVQGVSVAPANLPGALPPKPSVPIAPIAPVKPYSADPYREPIE